MRALGVAASDEAVLSSVANALAPIAGETGPELARTLASSIEGKPTPTPSTADVAARLARVLDALTTAERFVSVGTELPAMSRVPSALRPAASLVGRGILRAAELVSRDQRAFNVAALQAIHELREAVSAIAVRLPR